jgi:polyhydroxybutyrate depolymerase
MTRILVAVLLGGSACAASAADPKRVEWTVGDAKREALVYLPAKADTEPCPVVLVFHGHGGTMQVTAKTGFQKQWPEAIIVCPQGLPTATGRDPKGERAGWQQKPGDNQDRDLKFVDAILKTLREQYRVDDKRVYATGHSNGGGFTYLLWRTRGQEFAAMAPSAAGAGALRTAKDVKPLPVLHIAGEKDQVVRFENQKRTMEAVRNHNSCEADGKAWAQVGNLVGTRYPSSGGTPFVSVIHPGTHRYPDEAPELIVKFFKEHARK